MDSANDPRLMEQPPSGRIAGLDFIRGIAILLVLCRHLHLASPDADAAWLHQVLFVAQRGGWCGVDLFFVLSGFLVSGILFRQHQANGTLRVREFLIRRGFKIYPAFWMMLETTVIYNILAGGTVSVNKLCNELLFVQNYFTGMYGHTWSLAVEEHCYLGIVVLFLILMKVSPNATNPFRNLPLLACVGLAGAWWMRWNASTQLDELGPRSILFPTHLRFDGFLAGTALASVSCYQRDVFLRLCGPGRGLWIVIGCVLLLPVFVFDVRHDPVVVHWLLTTDIGVAIAWILAVHAGVSGARSQGNNVIQISTRAFSRMIEFIGEHSYSIYLWHDLLELILVRPLLGRSVVPPESRVELWVATYMAVTLGGGILMAYLVERPALSLRDRWFPRTAERGSVNRAARIPEVLL